MRITCLAILALCSTSVFAYEFPAVENPVASQLIEQYKKDKALIDAPEFTVLPNPGAAWPCNVPEVEQYKIAGLQAAHPELRAETEKATRKAFREAGMSTQMLPKSSFSNIRIVPLKVQCVAGKLDGEIQVLSSYDKRDETNLTIPSGNKVIKSTNVMTSHVVTRSHHTFRKGEQVPASTTFMHMTMQTETHYDDEQMEEMTRKNNEKLGLNKPMTTRTVTYSTQDGTLVTLMEMEEKKVSAGLFGVNVEPVLGLTTMVYTPTGPNRKRTQTFKDNRLVATGGMKDNKPHGEQITYMENYIKKMNLRLDQQPGMENAREVTINGVDLIEMRNCMQNGAPVKMSPCPGD